MSPVMTDRQSVGANAVVTNVLSGKLHEFLATASVVRLFATGSAVGLNVSFLVGSESYVQDQEVNSQNRLPIIPDDFVGEGVGGPGERILVSFRNTTGAAITAFTRIEVESV